jgi:hypothetical protein
MRDYWSAIFEAWEETNVTEHEYFLIPAIYTPPLVNRLGAALREAEAAIDSLSAANGSLSRNTALYAARVRFVRLGYEVIKHYTEMVKSAATELNYEKAIIEGQEGLRARDALTEMNNAFTTPQLESGYAFWKGEIQQYRELLSLVNGERGRLLAPLPLEWSFHRDPNGTGMDHGFLSDPVDLSFWRAHHQEYDRDTLKDYPIEEWEMIRTDLYVQAQGVRHPDQRSFSGDIWYRTQVRLSPEQVEANPHVHFPGLFNECELYVNETRVASRQLVQPWWLNDYRFEWDISLVDRMNPGENTITLHCHNPHHMGGMFRRPFLYTPVSSAP